MSFQPKHFEAIKGKFYVEVSLVSNQTINITVVHIPPQQKKSKLKTKLIGLLTPKQNPRLYQTFEAIQIFDILCHRENFEINFVAKLFSFKWNIFTCTFHRKMSVGIKLQEKPMSKKEKISYEEKIHRLEKIKSQNTIKSFENNMKLTIRIKQIERQVQTQEIGSFEISEKEREEEEIEHKEKHKAKTIPKYLTVPQNPVQIKKELKNMKKQKTKKIIKTLGPKQKQKKVTPSRKERKKEKNQKEQEKQKS